MHRHGAGQHRVIDNVTLRLRNPGEALGNHAHVHQVDLLHPFHVTISDIAEEPEHLLKDGVGELTAQAILEVAHRIKQVAQRSHRVPAERRNHSAVSELDVHQLEDIPAVAAIAGIEEPLASGLHITDAAVVLVNDDAAAPGRIVAGRV